MVGSYTLLSALALSSVAAAVPTSKRRTNGPKHCELGFNKRLQFQDGVFRTAVFADLHFGENGGRSWGKTQDDMSNEVMKTVLQAEHPHFVVFNGDQVTGEGLLAETATLAYDYALKATVNSNLPFAAVYGNHDNSVNISHTKLYQHEKSMYTKWSMTQANADSATDKTSIYNYVLPVFENDAATSPSLLLWFFDSRGGIFEDPAKYEDWVDPKVASWISTTADCILSTYKLSLLPPSVAFVHIPVKPMKRLQKVDVNRRPLSYLPAFINDDLVNWQGINHPAVQNPDAPFWKALGKTLNGAHAKGVIATVVGHNHGNDWCAKSKDHGLICYARHTGHGGYGTRTRGSRVIEVRSGKKGKNETRVRVAKSWIRLETGERISESILWRA